MRYLRLGDLGASSIPLIQSARPPVTAMVLPTSVRKRVPEGSLVPVARARGPMPVGRPTTKAQFEKYRKARLAQTARFVTLAKQLPKVAVRQVARSMRGLGMIGFGAPPDEAEDQAAESMARYAEIRSEIDETFADNVSNDRRLAYGWDSAIMRTGELSGSLGIDVRMDELAGGLWRYVNQVSPAEAVTGSTMDALGSVDFENMLAVYRDQGRGLSDLTGMLDSLESVYGGPLREFGELGTAAWGDAIAGSEGGIRRQMNEIIGSNPEWLTSETMAQVGTAIGSWVGAAQSGKTSGYIKAALGTVGTVLSFAGPVGAAAGTIISLATSLFDRASVESSLEKPPTLEPCQDLAPDAIWRHNPQAWWALAVAYCCEDGNGNPFDSPLYRSQTEREGILKELQRMNWHATIDKYTGEVMVKRPKGQDSGDVVGTDKFMRLLDAFPNLREQLVPEDDPYRVFHWLTGRVTHKVASNGEFTDVASYTLTGAALCGMSPRPSDNRSFLWCIPTNLETRVSFIGAENSPDPTYAFRFGTGTAPPSHIPQFDLWSTNTGASGAFWTTYHYALIVSMYLGGTVPYGISPQTIGGNRTVGSRPRCGTVISTGVGGTLKQMPFMVVEGTPSYVAGGDAYSREMVTLGTNTLGRYAVPSCRTCPEAELSSGTFKAQIGSPLGIRVPTSKGLADPSVPLISLAHLPGIVKDPFFRRIYRIPIPSPKVQYDAADAVVRPALLPRELGPNMIYTITPVMLDQRAKSGLFGSIPTWQVLAGLGLLGGVAYALTKKRS